MPEPPLPRVSVVVPVHNEADYVTEALETLLAEMKTVRAAVTVTVVENGSTDETAALVEGMTATHPELRLLRLPVGDYGLAMREGFLAADGDWVVNFDIDYFSAAFVDEVLDHGDDADLVLASKRLAGSDDRRSPWRRLATWTFNQLLRFVLRSAVSDTHGMKAVRREVVEALAPVVRSTQDLFDTELVLRAERAGYRIVEVPARVEELRPAKSSLLRRVPRTLAGIWRLRRELDRDRLTTRPRPREPRRTRGPDRRRTSGGG